MSKTVMTITFVVNADPGEAWEMVDHWIGTTAPEAIDSFHVDSNDIEEVSDE